MVLAAGTMCIKPPVCGVVPLLWWHSRAVMYKHFIHHDVHQESLSMDETLAGRQCVSKLYCSLASVVLFSTAVDAGRPATPCGDRCMICHSSTTHQYPRALTACSSLILWWRQVQSCSGCLAKGKQHAKLWCDIMTAAVLLLGRRRVLLSMHGQSITQCLGLCSIACHCCVAASTWFGSTNFCVVAAGLAGIMHVDNLLQHHEIQGQCAPVLFAQLCVLLYINSCIIIAT